MFKSALLTCAFSVSTFSLLTAQNRWDFFPHQAVPGNIQLIIQILFIRLTLLLQIALIQLGRSLRN